MKGGLKWLFAHTVTQLIQRDGKTAWEKSIGSVKTAIKSSGSINNDFFRSVVTSNSVETVCPIRAVFRKGGRNNVKAWIKPAA